MLILARIIRFGEYRDWEVRTQLTARKLKFYDGTAGATRMVIDSSGKVGNGTDDPGSKLTVDQARRSRSGNRFKSYSFENRNTR